MAYIYSESHGGIIFFFPEIGARMNFVVRIQALGIQNDGELYFKSSNRAATVTLKANYSKRETIGEKGFFPFLELGLSETNAQNQKISPYI